MRGPFGRMTVAYDFDLVVIGFGSAGMTAAELGADLGLGVCVVERARAGGDCLWTGCVPSKALIASARVAHLMRTADRVGLAAHDPDVDLGAVWARARAVQQAIAVGDDDPARFTAKGIDIRWGTARLAGPHAVEMTSGDGDQSLLTARVVLVCTGGRPAIPEIAGLSEAGFMTNETLFDLVDVPRRLAFIGGGPIAVELAQACRRLGIATTILQRAPTLLTREEPELVAQLTAMLRHEGVEVATGVRIERVERVGTAALIVGTVDGVERRWETDAIVVATGRVVDTEALGLAAAGVVADDHGVHVDARGRTAIPSIYAAGDVTGRELFTHAAAQQAVVAVRDAFYPGRASTGAVVPWATFTDPQLAHAGSTIAEAAARFGTRRVEVHRWSLAHNDRAHTDASDGAIVLIEHVRPGRRRLVGAHVLAEGADELIGELVLAIERGMSVADLAGTVHVYPTIATSLQQLGGRAAVARAGRYRWLMRRGGRS
ncbi:MAG: FAD-dependent oxidoreductase [Ilumatobacteraceae bacterium]